MSTSSVVSQITAQEVAYLPTVLAAVHAAETVHGATGPQKLEAVVQAAAATLAATSPNPNVAAIASLASLSVAVLNLLGEFMHNKTPAVS